VAVDSEDGIERWAGEHDGYRGMARPAIHRRSVRLDTRSHRLSITDELITQGRHRCRLAFHLGPSVDVTLDGSVALLRWASPERQSGARLTLPARLQWTLVRGETDPIVGWYSPRFGVKEPSGTLVGTGACGADEELLTVVDFGVGLTEAATSAADGFTATP
jgi:hypothetical protein